MAEAQKNAVMIDEDQWETMSINEDYHMESSLFDYNSIKEQANFGIKKY